MADITGTAVVLVNKINQNTIEVILKNEDKKIHINQELDSL